MPRLGLALNQKRFNSTSRVTGAAINMGATRGIGSTTRMFYYCRQHSEAPSECINQFINIQGQSNNTVASWSTQAGKLLNPPLFGGYSAYMYGIAADSNGNIYIGVNDENSEVYSIKKWNGTSWSTIGGSFDGYIYAIAIDSNDNIYVGGDFSYANGNAEEVNCIAKWDPLLSSWEPLVDSNDNIGLNGTVYSLAFHSNNNLYVGGDFTTAGGILAAKSIAVWNGSDWSALGNLFSDYGIVYGSTRSICFDNNNNVYIGGYFINNFYVIIDGIFKWDPVTNGGEWSTLGTGINDTCYAIVIDSNNNVYVGGAFTEAGGNPANYIAKWDGSNWSALGDGFNSTVYAMAFDSNNNLYIGGTFVYDSNSVTQYFYTAKWNGTEWSKLDLGLSDYNFSYNDNVTGMVYFNNKIYMTGQMYGSNTTPYTNFSARVNLLNLSLTAVAGNNFKFQDGNFNAYAVDSLGNLYVGGYFSSDEGSPANYIAKWDGSNWFALGSGLDEGVTAIAIDSDNNVYVGGYFSSAGGNPVNYIAKWDGSNWSALGDGLSDVPSSIAIDSDNNVYVVGGFTEAGGNTVNYIAKWNGSNWSALGSGLNEYVEAIAIDSDNNIYVGGYFSSAGGNPVNYIAKWDGSNWSALGSGLDEGVTAIAIDSDNNVYVGGYFSSAGGNPVNYIAKWDGSNWSALGSGLDGNNYNDLNVYSLAIDSTNNVYVGGYFDKAGGVLINSNIAKWNPLGSGSWSNFDTYLGGNTVYELYIKNQQLYITSDTAYNTDLSPGFIIWNI
jgi:hypothetical protein